MAGGNAQRIFVQPAPDKRPADRQPLLEAQARAFLASLRTDAVNMAGMLGAPPRSRELTTDEELTLWNTRAPGVDEQALWAQGYTPAQVGAQVFPHRLKMITSGTRAFDPKAQGEYALSMATRAQEALAGAMAAEAGPAQPIAMPMDGTATPPPGGTLSAPRQAQPEPATGQPSEVDKEADSGYY